MKNDNWILYVLVGFTSLTTVLLVSQGGASIVGIVQGLIVALVLDGLIMHWDKKRVSYNDENQRAVANIMTWVGVGIVAIFAVLYGVMELAPANNAPMQISIAGVPMRATVGEIIYSVAFVLAALWIVGTICAILFIRQIDPATQLELEKAKARQEHERIQLEVFQEFMAGTKERVGMEDAMAAFRAELKSRNRYSAQEIEQIVSEERTRIEALRHVEPIEAPALFQRINSDATVPTLPANPTPKPTRRR